MEKTHPLLAGSRIGACCSPALCGAVLAGILVGEIAICKECGLAYKKHKEGWRLTSPALAREEER